MSSGLVSSPKETSQVIKPGTVLCFIGCCSLEFLRTIGHLRPRTNTFGAITRISSCLTAATHQFFQNEGFLHVHTPIITASDCEGAGEMFQVTTITQESKPSNESTLPKDFFGKPTFLTVSGQVWTHFSGP